MGKTKWWIPAVLLLIAIPGWLWLGRPWLPRGASPTVYRMGWTDSPPFEVRGTDGRPGGFAVDLVKTAAERRGIRLQWVYWDRNSEFAFSENVVDLWPLMTVTPERLQHFHISEPYLETEFCMLVRADGPHVKMQDLAAATISFSNRPVDSFQLDRYLPKARRLSRTEKSEVMEDMCLQRSDAAFMNAFAGIATLLDKPGACRDLNLRWIAAPEIRSRMGIALTFALRGTADDLRDEISSIAAEGKLGPILGESGYLSQQLESMEALLGAERRARLLAGSAVLFALLFGVAFWQSVRILRERNRTREAERSRQDAERSRRETEHKLRLMANNMKEMVLAYDMDRHLTFANPAVETLTGYKISDLETGGFPDWIHPDHRARMLDYREGLFRGTGFEDEEYRLITRDGRTKWASATWGPLRDDAGRQIGVQGSERDITDRKLADEALRESERRFRGLLENVQLPAAMFDLHGNYVFVNDYTLAITGWTREEMLGHHATQFMPPEQADRVRQAIGNLTRPGAPAQWFSEPAMLTRDGKLRLLQVNNLVLRDSGGAIMAVASLGTDVTEHRALQEQYLQSQKLESLGTLAGGVAHDFNNLLTVINGYSKLVLRSLDENDPVRPKIDQIHMAGKRAAELTQQLLTFSRKQITQPQAVDLNELLDESAAMFRSLLGDDIELTMELSRPLGSVTTDPGQMHQVLMNLLANARDAMPDGGKVTIRTHNITVSTDFQAEHPEVAPGPCVVLVVSDTGVGMDEQTRAHLFEPFFTTKGLGKGTGLGLSTVYGIVKQSGGWIWVSSETGNGTTFRIHLPCINASQPEGQPADAEDPHSAEEPAHSETVLVVEDQDEVRGLTILILESLGYRVLSVADGAAAIALASSYDGRIDLLLTDVVLPGMNGKQLAERLSSLRPGMAVLFTSGYSGEVIAHRGVLDRDVAYIAKPYSPEDLAAKVREMLDRQPLC